VRGGGREGGKDQSACACLSHSPFFFLNMTVSTRFYPFHSPSYSLCFTLSLLLFFFFRVDYYICPHELFFSDMLERLLFFCCFWLDASYCTCTLCRTDGRFTYIYMYTQNTTTYLPTSLYENCYSERVREEKNIHVHSFSCCCCSFSFPPTTPSQQYLPASNLLST